MCTVYSYNICSFITLLTTSNINTTQTTLPVSPVQHTTPSLALLLNESNKWDQQQRIRESVHSAGGGIIVGFGGGILVKDDELVADWLWAYSPNNCWSLCGFYSYIHILSFPQFYKAWLHKNMEYASVSVQYMQEQCTLLLVKVYKFTEPVSYFNIYVID